MGKVRSVKPTPVVMVKDKFILFDRNTSVGIMADVMATLPKALQEKEHHKIFVFHLFLL